MYVTYYTAPLGLKTHKVLTRVDILVKFLNMVEKWLGIILAPSILERDILAQTFWHRHFGTDILAP